MALIGIWGNNLHYSDLGVLRRECGVLARNTGKSCEPLYQIYDILKLKDSAATPPARYYAAIERLTAAQRRNGGD